MLVLSRKVGERILIGDQIAVTVVRITGGGVRIGIEAPAEMPVIREELKESLDKKSTESKESKGIQTSEVPSNKIPASGATNSE